MKKIILILTMTMMVFALALGAAYAADVAGSAPMNGITTFSKLPLALDDGAIEHTGGWVAMSEPAENYVESSGAGGLREDKLLDNGITYFEILPERGYEAGSVVENGITVFD
jgi:hypothetical protein